MSRKPTTVHFIPKQEKIWGCTSFLHMRGTTEKTVNNLYVERINRKIKKHTSFQIFVKQKWMTGRIGV